MKTTTRYVSVRGRIKSAERGYDFEQHVWSRLQNNEFGLPSYSQKSFQYQGDTCQPDFIVQSRGRSACVVIDAKNYHGRLGKQEVEKLARDMRGAEKNGYGHCRLGVLFCRDDTILSENTINSMHDHGIILHRESEGRTALLRRVHAVFYGC